MQFKYATPSSARAAIVLPAHSTPGSLGRRRNRALPDSGVAFTLPAVPAGPLHAASGSEALQESSHI
ncbi:hypothetical protein G6F65_022881 [Rhizopus arrhizus]|nr:hypothetical protein G6F24_018284 [Rhizopus arrhizus]KAG1242692.1 hypothetical protein G6F65_022881 [Rhizopus arrhizus]